MALVTCDYYEGPVDVAARLISPREESVEIRKRYQRRRILYEKGHVYVKKILKKADGEEIRSDGQHVTSAFVCQRQCTQDVLGPAIGLNGQRQ